MKAYGTHRRVELEDFGPPSRGGKLKSANRTKMRRALHKRGRKEFGKSLRKGWSDT